MNLLIKDFPDELAKALKVEAVEAGMTLKELVVEKCSTKNKLNGTSGLIESVEEQKGNPVKRQPRSVRKDVESVTPPTVEAASVGSGCAKCGRRSNSSGRVFCEWCRIWFNQE